MANAEVCHEGGGGSGEPIQDGQRPPASEGLKYFQPQTIAARPFCSP